MAADHTALDTQRKDLCKNFLKNRFRVELTRAAYRTVPGQFLVNVIAQEVKHVQTQGTLLNKPAVTDDVFQVAHQAEFEEDNGVYTLLPTLAIKTFG